MGMIPFPDKKYSIIYADPPWAYNNGDRIKSAKDDSFIDVNDHYPTMSMKELKTFDLKSIAEDDCLLFCWVLTPLIPECIDVCKTWGFKYRTMAFMWDKQNTHLGYYTMSNCELCGVFKRGKIPQPRGSRGEQQLIEATEIISVQRRRHSQKPDEARDRIVEMFPTQSKIELFARERFDGWDAWGNEV